MSSTVKVLIIVPVLQSSTSNSYFGKPNILFIIYIYITETFETPTIFHVSTILKKKKIINQKKKKKLLNLKKKKKKNLNAKSEP